MANRRGPETADDLVARLRDGEAAQLAELAEFVSIPSTSADPARRPQLDRAAEFLAGGFRRAGLENVTIHATDGHPIVTCDWRHAPPGSPTVLIYGHYDVQPEEPVADWSHDPFEMTIVGDRVYGRGTTDDKGQLWMHLKAVECLLRNPAGLHAYIRFLADGEEEIGSASLPDFIRAHPEAVSADIAVVSDSPAYSYGQPSIGYALRGLCYVEVTARTLAVDVHSGQFGGSVANAAQVLVGMLASLHDADGRVSVPGFYDRVARVSAEERRGIRGLAHDEAAWLAAVGARCGVGEHGYSTLERTWIRPTLEINGVHSGYQGPGPKTIVPCAAKAKITCRLVPDMNPDEIIGLLEEHLRRIAPGYADVRVSDSGFASHPVIMSTDRPMMKVMERALSRGFAAPVRFVRDGGSIPAVAMLDQLAKVPTIMVGFGCPDENKHGPDEWLSLEHYRRGLAALAYFWTDPALKGE